MAGESNTTVTLTFEGVTPAQAIALDRMVAQMRTLSAIGSSRYVAFYADGDGNFRPRIKVHMTPDPYGDRSEMERNVLANKAEVKADGDTIFIDFDPVAWALHHEEDANGE